MMTKPTVAELLEKAENRYILVAATAKRAREISSGNKPLVETDDVAAVSIAADEIDSGKIMITRNVKFEEEITESNVEE